MDFWKVMRGLGIWLWIGSDWRGVEIRVYEAERKSAKNNRMPCCVANVNKNYRYHLTSEWQYNHNSNSLNNH